VKIFRYSMELPLDMPFHASFTLIEPREITDRTAMFKEIVEAIKKAGCSWEMIETSERLVERGGPESFNKTVLESRAPIIKA
jgi:hypothetical protein